MTFDDFWKAYPLKVAKKKARRAWSRIAPAKHPLVMAALEKQKTLPRWKKNDGEFIPYAATWLNDERWEDEVVLPGEKQSSNEADILVEALKLNRAAPAGLSQDIMLRFRKMCAATATTWPRLHHELKSGIKTPDQVKADYLAVP